MYAAMPLLNPYLNPYRSARGGGAAGSASLAPARSREDKEQVRASPFPPLPHRLNARLAH